MEETSYLSYYYETKNPGLKRRFRSYTFFFSFSWLFNHIFGLVRVTLLSLAVPIAFLVSIFNKRGRKETAASLIFFFFSGGSSPPSPNHLKSQHGSHFPFFQTTVYIFFLI